jgi:hypothetical protein
LVSFIGFYLLQDVGFGLYTFSVEKKQERATGNTHGPSLLTESIASGQDYCLPPPEKAIVLHGRWDRFFVSLSILISWITERRGRVKAKNRWHSASLFNEGRGLQRPWVLIKI